ncbi:MAG TPA: adenine phosphoribosyltransferase [Nitrososphaeraceae archaeon]|jgi:adenine phosphoribosyltransferase|nr:adenine phosphoribosyltransferase [Nitrososphaeraceae archaeon]
MNDAEFKELVRIWPDFPTKGISFKDVNPLIRSSESLTYLDKRLFEICNNLEISKIAAIEARGFFVGSLLASSLKKGLVLIRKEGKLPGPTSKEPYTIEYGTRVMEIQQDAILSGEKILIADDLLATGGTAMAAASLVEKSGATVVGFVFIICLNYLEGPNMLKKKGYKVNSILEFD